MTARIFPIRQAAVNCYLIQGDGVILVDTGMPETAGRFPAILKAHGIHPADIRLILLTHGHFDHIGGVSALRSLTGCPVAIHQGDCALVEQGYAGEVPLLSTTLWARTFNGMMGLMMRASSAPYPTVKADLILDDRPFLLHPYGVEGTVYATPGHTRGSISVLLDSGDTFIGDTAVNGLPFRFGPGPSIFGDDWQVMKRSWKMLIEKGAKKVYPGHGRPFWIRQLEPFLKNGA